jgi:uncharacterized phiE125 gp8 family phage protein
MSVEWNCESRDTHAWPRSWSVRSRASLVTPPTAEPIDVASVKLYSRITSDVEDLVVDTLIRQARQQVERDTQIALLTQTWDVAFDNFPAAVSYLPVPIGPLQSVTSVTTYDTAEVGTVFSASNYWTDVFGTYGRIGLKDTITWPSSLRPQNALVARVLVGYTSVDLIPESLLHAIRILVTHWFEYRGAQSPLDFRAVPEAPPGYQALINAHVPVTLA